MAGAGPDVTISEAPTPSSLSRAAPAEYAKKSLPLGLLAAAAAALLIAVLAVGYFVLRPDPTPPVVNGTVVLNALPWGEVVSIVNGDGEAVALPRPYTPLRLELPVGSYTVTIKPAGADAEQQHSLTVDEGTSQHTLGESSDDALNELLEGLGW